MRWRLASPLALVLLAISTPALADPCKAIPDRGPAPAWLSPGVRFSGPVTYVGDGDSLCVATGAGPANWVEVRLADFYAPELHAPGGPEAKATLARLAKGRRVDCVADHQTYDRMAAVCRLNGRSLGDLMRAAGVAEGGRGW
jgi:endonuclease YncB( thermonuclease family)